MSEIIAEQADTIPASGLAVSSARNSVSPFFLRAIVFVGGLTSIGIELSAARLLAPYFGTSMFIWANLIGLTLTYLAIGYYLGGRLADRHPKPWLLFTITAIAAFFSGIIPVIAHPILITSLDAFDRVAVGAFYGSLVGTILLFAVPVTLLGFVTPFAIRLQMTDVHSAGITAGNIYALSTIGSIAGSFLPVLLLIPLVGTSKTFLILSLLLMALSFAGLIGARARWLPIIVALLAVIMLATSALAAPAHIKPAYRGQLVYEAESEYNYIQVLKDGDEYLLALNEGHAIHSIYNPNQLLTGGPWDYFMMAPFFNQQADQHSVKDALLIGLAGGTAARQLTAAYPGIQIDGVEIDPEIVKLGRKYFDMTEPNLHVYVEDGRYFLRRSDHQYDLIAIDAYRQPYIPFQLTSKEFFQEVSDHLNPNGAAVVNVGRTATDYRLVDVIASTMRAVYPHVYVIEVASFTNTMVIGTKSDLTKVANFTQNVEGLPPGSVLRAVGEQSLATGDIREIPPGGTVFTDDHAPVERVVDKMIIDAAREEDTAP
jgi:spermidine synthase